MTYVGAVRAALAATGDPYRAACEGAWLHTEAGRLAGPAVLSSELAERVAQAYAACL